MVAFGALGIFFVLLSNSAAGQHSLDTFRSQHPFRYAQYVANYIVALVSGLFMLRGLNWARWLFTLWYGLNAIAALPYWFSSQWATHALRLLFFGLFCLYLFRPAANEFFRGPLLKKSAEAAREAPFSDPESAQATCAECGNTFSIAEMIPYAGVYVCAGCKPIFFQKLAEGADGPPPPASAT
jgi:hypothetical protein